ncbi:Helix-turn-helix domain protein [compost metagenome]
MPQYLSPAEVARILSVHRSTVYLWIEDKTIPPDFVFRIGRTVRIRVDFIEHQAKSQHTEESPSNGPAA